MGRDFLPRGTGIVTRRPLLLQLINRSSGRRKSSTRPSSRDDGAEVPEVASKGEQSPPEKLVGMIALNYWLNP